MKSFFTSSLDTIDPPAPYVNAMNWEAYRNQFRINKNNSERSTQRNCALASSSLNPESADSFDSNCRGQDFPLIVQNMIPGSLRIEIQPETQPLIANDVDECFGNVGIEFLEERISTETRTSCMNDSSYSRGNSFDLELGLLESVQEIAVALVRTTPKRAVPAGDAVE